MNEFSPRPRVLIVEDESVVAADLRISLEGLGYEVVGTAETAAAAIRQVENVRPDLVLMDIQLRGPSDGIEAAEEIRRRWQTAVVFLTANANAETIEGAGATGAYGYVLKPFRLQDLNATLLIAMHQHRVVHDLFSEQTWLKTMMACLTDGVIATDDQGHVRYLNDAAERLTGWSAAEALGRPIEQVYSVTTLDALPASLSQIRLALAARAPTRTERLLLRKRDGNFVPVEDAATPILSGDRVLGAVSVIVDMTDRLRREREQDLERDRLEEQMQAATEALGETRVELRALSAHLIAAQEEERRRIARELHDDLGQQAAVADMQLEDVVKSLSSDGGQEAVLAMRRTLTDLSKGLREISHRLHPSVIADLGLSAAVHQLVDQFRDAGIEATFADHGTPVALPFEAGTALYRIAQEALRNAAKHGEGAPVRVLLDWHNEQVHLIVQDAGPGFDVNSVRPKGGLGLVSMQERARLAGGTLLLRSRPGEGTLILVRVPISRS